MTSSVYYGDLELPGEIERAISLTAHSSDLVLLHGNFDRLKLILNLAAQLQEHHIHHTLVLSFIERGASEPICDVLRRHSKTACATCVPQGFDQLLHGISVC